MIIKKIIYGIAGAIIGATIAILLIPSYCPSSNYWMVIAGSALVCGLVTFLEGDQAISKLKSALAWIWDNMAGL